MKPIVTFAGIIAAINLLSIAEARPPCHLYSRWYYPWPQRCSFVHMRGGEAHHTPLELAPVVTLKPPTRGGAQTTEKVGNAVPNQERSTNIPLPELTPVTWGPWANDETQARIKLRLELEK